MRSRDFIYWLQGFMELSETETLSAKQVEVIKNHLNLVFLHEIDPEMGDQDHQDNLNAAHEGKQSPADVIKPEQGVHTSSAVFRC